MRFAVIGSLLLMPLVAQDFKLPASIERLAEKASEVVDVTMDSSMLQLASRFLSDKDADSAKLKRMIGGLKGIYVRSFEFEKPGEYRPSDVDALRSQVQMPAWSRIVGVRSRKGENADIYLKTEGGQITGLLIIAAEPKELTIVRISGAIRPEDLQELGGHFGIPKLESEPSRKGEKEHE